MYDLLTLPTTIIIPMTVSVAVADVLLLRSRALARMQRPPRVVCCRSIASVISRRLQFPVLYMLTHTCSHRPLVTVLGATRGDATIVWSKQHMNEHKAETSTSSFTRARLT